ncbi:MAG: DUF4325 domain-containing protein [Actinobacteria bacterium]|nr:DUF4325 domain-containing protein [Actinomycetota bacterium]
MRSRKRSPIPALIRSLFAESETVTSGEVAAAAGITRQAALYHLVALVEAGELRREGRGRGARYRRDVDLSLAYPLEGLGEDRVWHEVEGRTPELADVAENVRSILRFAFTEMLNNAIDHSGGSRASVLVWARDPVAFEVVDDGVGVFAHVQRRFGLESPLDSIAELAKGKRTTDPARHTGEGIFFTSKVVDRFQLEGNRVRWVVDNVLGDQSVGGSPIRSGTRVRCEVDRSTRRTTREVFDRFSSKDTYEFSRSRIDVRLYDLGDRLISRSEAKRLTEGLDRFEEVILDFSGVEEVGQGFVDELFRVWGGRHPGTRLHTVNMTSAVEFVVERGLP